MKVFAAIFFALTAICPAREEPKPITKIIPWLLDEDERLKNIAFSDVIFATSGKRVIPIDRSDKETRRILGHLSKALDEVIKKMNAENSPTRRQKRINEMSAYFEKALRDELDSIEGFSCDFPKTAAGEKQRSGYPDLRLLDEATGRVIYIDPKLHAKASKGSNLRTFYFTPKRETNKVNDDAHHLVAGFEHESNEGVTLFKKWELIDLAQFRVQFKAEFEGSNRDLYRADSVVGRSK